MQRRHSGVDGSWVWEYSRTHGMDAYSPSDEATPRGRHGKKEYAGEKGCLEASGERGRTGARIRVPSFLHFPARLERRHGDGGRAGCATPPCHPRSSPSPRETSDGRRSIGART